MVWISCLVMDASWAESVGKAAAGKNTYGDGEGQKAHKLSRAQFGGL
jgi:hypothetical protein